MKLNSNKQKQIVSTPPLPPELVSAIGKKRLILFLGAGISCAAGVKDWDTISNMMLDTFNKEKLLLDDEFIQLVERENYYTRFEFLRRKNQGLFKKLFIKYLNINDPKIITRFKLLIEKLVKFKPISIVTTNVDNLIEKVDAYSNNKVYYKDKCNPQNLHDNGVFCIHGNVEDNIFILSEKTKYYTANNDFRFFLHNIFGSFCILFLGYSLDRNDVLEAFYANTNNLNGIEFYHHALVPSDLSLPELELRMKYKIKLHKYSNNEGFNHKYFPETINDWLSKLESPVTIEAPKEPSNVPEK